MLLVLGHRTPPADQRRIPGEKPGFQLLILGLGHLLVLPLVVVPEKRPRTLVPARLDFHTGRNRRLRRRDLHPVLLTPHAHPEDHLPEVDLLPQVHRLRLVTRRRHEPTPVHLHLGNRSLAEALSLRPIADHLETQEAEVLGGEADLGDRIEILLFVGQPHLQGTVVRPLFPRDRDRIQAARQFELLEDEVGAVGFVCHPVLPVRRVEHKTLDRSRRPQINGVELVLQPPPGPVPVRNERGGIAIHVNPASTPERNDIVDPPPDPGMSGTVVRIIGEFHELPGAQPQNKILFRIELEGLDRSGDGGIVHH